MAGVTDHYGFTRLGPGDAFSTDGYKFTDEDRVLLDRLLYIAAEGHIHTGATPDAVLPDTGPSLTLSTTGGLIPAGTRVYYQFTYVNGRGEETTPSPETFIDTPLPVQSPNTPGVDFQPSGGSLGPGNYYYALSAYVTADINETKAESPGWVTVPVASVTNRVTVTFPSVPAGADGFNIYRRKPGQTKYFFVTSVPTGGSTPPTSWVDDGSIEEDCDRSIPVRNSTNGTNSILVSVPGGVVPAGHTWRLYRTYVSGDYRSSTLSHIIEYVSEGSDVVTPTYTDVGAATTAGSPPASLALIGNPSKIQLEDGAEVQGKLPMGMTAFPFQVTLNYSGPLQLSQGSAVWTCEFPRAEIVWVRAALGRGSSPASDPVIVDLNIGSGEATPSFASAFATQANRPVVPVGLQVGERTTPDINTLLRGDMLTIDIDQTGGGATPTDRDLTVSIYLLVHGYPGADSYTDGESGGIGGIF